MMQPRSWLFVPADSERKIAKALESHADALIFDLEDSVVPAQKAAARAILKNLPKRSGGPVWWVRVNPLASEHHKDDLEVLGIADIHGIVLPKAEGGTDVIELSHRTGTIPIHAIVTETPGSLFNLMSYQTPGSPLVAMSWGAEDLSAALGASSKYDESGDPGV
jgi:citrate lyase subunit beta/citryl-CoA lyase